MLYWFFTVVLLGNFFLKPHSSLKNNSYIDTVYTIIYKLLHSAAHGAKSAGIARELQTEVRGAKRVHQFF